VSKIAVVFDVDGVFTPGTFYSTKEGKFLKEFGADDWDMVRELQKCAEVHLVTADKKGWDIVKRRVVDECNFKLDLVPNKPVDERWKWIKKTYPEHKIVYVGDGVYDWYCLEKADFSLTTIDALDHVQRRASWIVRRRGGDRFVAEACIRIMDHYDIGETWNVGLDK
jgi:3-deoxy-D-manno-octulosonate 8-phosphate phosphatase (KDO 8-P phosphatase)